ncbi:MAG: alpha/beta hydrolase-fold protein, partial [Bacteroidota bacterium]
MKRIIILILVFYYATNLYAQEGQALTYFYSTYLNEKVPYQVYFPQMVKKQVKTIDLLVVLDGSEYAGIAQNTMELYIFGKKMKPNIILSLPSTSKSRWSYFTPTKAKADNDGGQDTLYQHTGNFSLFADFLAKELIPHLESQYQVKIQKKNIFGHSMGGLGVLSFLVLRPEIFDNYISASPSTMYDQHYIFKTIEKKGKLDFNKLFLTAALNDSNGYKENVDWLDSYLEKHS